VRVFISILLLHVYSVHGDDDILLFNLLFANPMHVRRTVRTPELPISTGKDGRADRGEAIENSSLPLSKLDLVACANA
jgi:hypothetical protein